MSGNDCPYCFDTGIVLIVGDPPGENRKLYDPAAWPCQACIRGYSRQSSIVQVLSGPAREEAEQRFRNIRTSHFNEAGAPK